MRFRRYGCAGAAIIVAAFISPIAVAQETKEASAAAARGEGGGEPLSLDTISITATRNPIEAFEYPGMVTVIGRERIRTYQPSTPDDILSWVPNVEFSRGPRRTGEVPAIRGFSGNDVIVTIDGARQNFNAGHDGRFFIDHSLLREVEVLRGPASSLYGSGGTGGVIAFRTARAEDLLEPGETAGARVSAGYQTVNRERVGTFTAYGRPVPELDLLGSITKRDSGSIELGGGGKLDRTDDDIRSGLFKAAWQPADYHRVEASFQRFRNKAEEPSNGQGAGGSYLVDKDIRADNWQLAYSYQDPGNDFLDLDATVYHTAFQVDELRLDDAGGGPRGELLERDVRTFGFRVDNRSRLDLSDAANVTFTYGVEGYRDEQEGAADGGVRDGVPDAESEFGGAFAQAELRLVDPLGAAGDLLIIPGARYDYYSSSSALAEANEDRAVSPRLGIGIASAWLVRKPTRDGTISSLEIFDGAGGQIAWMFGQRDLGQPEREGWRKLLAGLPAAGAASA